MVVYNPHCIYMHGNYFMGHFLLGKGTFPFVCPEVFLWVLALQFPFMEP